MTRLLLPLLLISLACSLSGRAAGPAPTQAGDPGFGAETAEDTPESLDFGGDDDETPPAFATRALVIATFTPEVEGEDPDEPDDPEATETPEIEIDPEATGEAEAIRTVDFVEITLPPPGAETPTAPAPPATVPPATAPPATAPPATAGAPTNTPQPAGPDFLTVAFTARRQMEVFGGIIDIAVNETGYVDCQEVVDVYNAVAASPVFSVSSGLANAYALYRAGVDTFTATTYDMYLNCANYLINPTEGTIPFQQWGTARQGVNDSVELLRQAIIAAGGTP